MQLRSLAAAAAILGLFASPAAAQDEDTACAVLSEVLTEACDTGAIDRVLGDRYYQMSNAPIGDNAAPVNPMSEAGILVNGQLIEVDGEEFLGLTLRIGIPMGSMSFDMRLGVADGRTYEINMTMAMQGMNSAMSGFLDDDGVFRMSGDEFGQEMNEEFEWSDELVPEIVLMFVYSAFVDLESFPEELVYRDFEPNGPQVELETLTLLPEEEEGVRTLSRMTEREGGYERLSITVLTEGDDAWTILECKTISETEIVMGPDDKETYGHQNTFSAISEDDYQALIGELGGQ